jgi:ABC-type antimicrobial peptide transport system permease subunit
MNGRSFSEKYGDEKNNLIINERLENILGDGSALNKTLEIGEEYKGRIIGIVKDFHLESVSNSRIGPLILFLNPGINYIFVRIHPENISSTLDLLEQAWMKTAPHLPFTYNFLDEEFDQLYSDVENLGAILKYFTAVAVFIACLGLFALSSFAAERRTKEIGIRKVLGSSAADILILLNKGFLLLILMANVIAWPISWALLNNWLGKFPYRVSLSLKTFLISGLLTLVVTLLTVSFQTLKASFANPTHSLRYE